MAIPVITSPLTRQAVTHVSTAYRIRATNMPVSYDATPLPDKSQVFADSGIISMRIREAGIYPITISATNPDGEGTAILVVTAVAGPPPGTDNGQVTVYQAKYWNDYDGTERIDYADLDSAGQPIIAFDPGAIGVDQLKPSAFEIKVNAIGGAGRILQYTLPTDVLLPTGGAFSIRLGTLAATGLTAGDPVICNTFIGPNESPNGADAAPLNIFIYAGCESDDVVTFYGFTPSGPVTVPKGSRIDARAFTFL